MKRVLIVDDNAAILKSVSLLLGGLGFETITHNGAGDLARFVAKHVPDVILLDYLLSGKNGVDMVRQLKKNTEVANIPIIVVSAHPSAHLQMAKEGVYAFIQKPFDSESIVEKINQATKYHDRSSASATQKKM